MGRKKNEDFVPEYETIVDEDGSQEIIYEDRFGDVMHVFEDALGHITGAYKEGYGPIDEESMLCGSTYGFDDCDDGEFCDEEGWYDD